MSSSPQLQLTRRYLRVVRHRLPESIALPSKDENDEQLILQGRIQSWLEASLGEEFNKNRNNEEGENKRMDVYPVEWLPPWTLCYSIPKHVFLSQWSLHQMGVVIGMDPSSIATVVSLLQPTHTTILTQQQQLPPTAVLDTCCSPGMKTALIAELLHSRQHASKANTSSEEVVPAVVVGVDVSLNRLFTARSLLPKLLPSSVDVILSHADSTQFDPNQLNKHVADLTKKSIIGKSSSDGSPIQAAHLDSWKLKKQLQTSLKRSATDPVPTTSSFVWCSDSGAESRLFREQGGIPLLFSHVLVDVECTHDGSLSHIVVDTSSSNHNNDDIAASKSGPSTNTYQDSMHKYKPNYALHTDASINTSPTTWHVNGEKRARDERAAYHNEGENIAVVLTSNEEGCTATSLHDLQLGILTRAYNLLAPNGTLVYSTCSFSELQNEKLVEEFMMSQDNATTVALFYPRIQPAFEDERQQKQEGNHDKEKLLSSTSKWFHALKEVCQETHIRDATGVSLGMGVRLDPRQTGSSFQYIVKLVKCSNQ